MGSTNPTAVAFRARYEADPAFRAKKLAKNRAYNAAHPEIGRAAATRYRLRTHPPKPVLTDEDRFWAKVQKSDGCWLWIAARNRAGYGKFFFEGRVQTASRVAWRLTYGADVPDHLHACHHCDNPPCVRPNHLFLGGERENQGDRIAKGRPGSPGPKGGNRGERHWNHRFTAAQIAEIRTRYAAGGISQYALGREYGVAQGYISGIVSGRKWRI